MALEMSDQNLQIYVLEIRNQVQAARLSIDICNRAMQALHAGPGVSEPPVGAVFLGLQGVLTAAASISKLLWPAPASRDRHGEPLAADAEELRQATLERGRVLRKLLGAKDDGIAVLQKRAVRNAFEHLDERLDGYLVDQRNVVDRNIGPAGMITVGDQPAVALRALDPQRAVLSVLEDEVVVQDLVDAMLLLDQRASDWRSQPRS